MTILNFDCTLKVKNHTHNIKNNECDIMPNSQNTNKLIEIYSKKISKEIKKHATAIKSMPFEKYLEEIKYVEAAYQCLLSLKSNNCGGYNWSKTYEKFKEEMNWEFRLTSKDLEGDLSYVEQKVVREYTSSEYIGSTNTWLCFQTGSYDPIKDIFKNENILKDIASFNFKKYGCTKSITNSFTQEYKKLTILIAALKKEIKTHGNAIGQWSDAKISRHLGGSSDERLKEWTRCYRNHLLASGAATPKTKKSAIEKSREALENETASQEDYIRLFKLGKVARDFCYTTRTRGNSEADHAISKLNKKSLEFILKSEVKSTAARANAFASALAERYSKFVKTKEDMELLLANTWGIQNLQYFEQKIDLLTAENAITICEDKGLSVMLVDKFIKPLNLGAKYVVHASVSTHILKSASEKEKLYFLKNIRDFKVDYSDLSKLYENVHYDKIRPYFFTPSTAIGKEFIQRILDNKDTETAVKMTEKSRDYFKDLNTLLSFDQKIKVISKFSIYEVQVYFTKEENLIILEKALKGDLNDHCTKYVSDIVTKVKAKRQIENILIQSRPDYVDFEKEDVVKALSLPVKKYYRAQQDIFSKKQPYYYYRNYTNSALKEFYKDFTADDVLEVFGHHIPAHERPYLAHTFSAKRLRLEALKDPDFLRVNNNIDRLTYSFYKQFENNKELFKKFVGDRRDRSNKAFGELLLKKLNAPNSVKFMTSWLDGSE